MTATEFNARYGILAVSDISLGYGSPQIQMFLQSLAEHYDTRAYVIETDEPHRPPVPLKNCDRLDLSRSSSVQPYWCLSSHIERNFEALEMAREHQPPIIVLFSPMQLCFLPKLGYKPKKVIMYLLEIDAHMYTRALRLYAQHVDHFIFPEYERMRYVLGEIPKRPDVCASIIYNVASYDPDAKPLPVAAREKAILYAGTLTSDTTLALEFLEEPLSRLPIHVYGNFSGHDAGDLRAAFLARQGGQNGLRYEGYVPGAQLRARIPQYAFSFVRWNPAAGLNFHYACPNKFFEAIANGVPPVTAPHPQCIEVIKRFKCGILAEDFTAQGMYDACKRALDMFGSPEYEAMVENCQTAYKRFLNWDAQFARFATSLPSRAEVGL